MKKLTQEEFIKRVNKKQENQYEILGKYINKSSKIKVKCKKCGLEWCPVASILMNKRIGKNCNHHIKLNDKQVKEMIFNSSNGNITMIGTYDGVKTPTAMRCNICGYVWKTEPYIVYSGHGCPKCNNNAKVTNRTVCDYINDNHLQYKLIGNVTSSHSKVEFKHLTCGKSFMMSPHCFMSGQRCPYEANQRRAKSNSYSLNKINEILSKKTNNRYQVVDNYHGANKNAKCIDNKCGKTFICHPGQLSRGETGCPYCASSKGEKAVRKFLNDHHFIFKEQVKFNDCRYKRPLPFDFAVYNKSKKLIYLIEYQGVQHYRKSSLFDKKDSFKQRQLRDNIKKQWCKNNHIKLISIPYNDKESSLNKISEVVNKYLTHYMLRPSQAI